MNFQQRNLQMTLLLCSSVILISEPKWTIWSPKKYPTKTSGCDICFRNPRSTQMKQDGNSSFRVVLMRAISIGAKTMRRSTKRTKMRTSHLKQAKSRLKQSNRNHLQRVSLPSLLHEILDPVRVAQVSTSFLNHPQYLLQERKGSRSTCCLTDFADSTDNGRKR